MHGVKPTGRSQHPAGRGQDVLPQNMLPSSE